MFARILALLVVVALLSGATWYVFRETPQKQILRWREEASRSLFEDEADLERAEELNQKILKLVPNSAHDLIFKARIQERRGTRASLREALATYDQVLQGGDRNHLSVAFLKARICRTLGLMDEARGTLLSVADAFPFEAMMDLGHTALQAYASSEALRYFTKARELAPGKKEEAMATEGLAATHSLQMKLNARASSAREGDPAAGKRREEAEKMNAGLRESTRLALAKVMDFIRSDDIPGSAEDASQRVLWAIALAEKIALVKNEGETPYWDAVVLLNGKLKSFAPVLREISPELRLRLGALRLRAGLEEAERLPQGLAAELVKEAERDFVAALGVKPEEARRLLDLEPSSSGGRPEAASGAQPDGVPRAHASERDVSAREYRGRLLAIARVYLASREHHKLLNDPSPLELSRRIADGLSSSDPNVVNAFLVFSGLAQLKGGQRAEAERLFEKYLDGQRETERSLGALNVAEHISASLPDDALVFKFLDRFQSTAGNHLDEARKKISILLSARTRPALGEEASRRLDDELKALGEVVNGSAERVAYARLVAGIRGLDEASELLRETRLRFSDDKALRRTFAELLFDKANAAFTAGSTAGAMAAYREALGEFIVLFVGAPAESQEVIRRIVDISSKLEAAKEDFRLADHLKATFPSSSEADLNLVGEALQAVLRRQFAAALERLGMVEKPTLLQPFFAFLKGSCHLGLAGSLRAESGTAAAPEAREAFNARSREQMEWAKEAFRGQDDSTPNQFHLAAIAFQELPRGEDVSDALLERIEGLSEAEALEHAGLLLLAQALHRRFECRYRDESVKNSELARILGREQRALRGAIRRNPMSVAAYLALADSFLVSARADGSAETGGAGTRHIFAPDHEKAINVLKAVPVVDEQVLSRLAAYLEAAGQAEQAKRYLERLALLKPTAEVFSRLLGSYVQLDPESLMALLTEAGPESGPEAAAPEPRQELLARLRASFGTLPDHEGLRYSFLGMLLSVREAKTSGETAKKSLREELVAAYSKALAFYEGKKLPVPVPVLNNLAWYLAEADSAESRGRALALAGRAREMAPEPRQVPDVHDTHAWVVFRNGRLIEAAQLYRGLINAVDAPTYRYHLAQVLFELKEFDGALEEVRKALDRADAFGAEADARRLEVKIREARRKVIGE